MCINIMFFCFSTHILTRRMTKTPSYLSCFILIFNSHPHKEDDAFLYFYMAHTYFSTHILTRRMTLSYIFTWRIHTFQLTSSQGGWPYERKFSFRYHFFNSHPHKEDDNYLSSYLSSYYIFQLTSSQGGWHLSLSSEKTISVFQLTSSQGGWPKVSFAVSYCVFFQLTSSQGGWQQL